MDRDKIIEKIASEMLEAIATDIENQPMAKFASEEDKSQAIAEKLAEVYNEESDVQDAVSEVMETADAQAELAMEALNELGYDLSENQDQDQDQ